MAELTRAPLRALLGLVLATSAYYALARIGLLVAIGQSNASAIWAPSGLALALVLRYGLRIWPAIFLGAALANLTVFAQNQAGAPLLLGAVSLGIAAGNTLEALVAAWLVGRFVDAQLRLSSPRSVYLFTFAIGAAATVAALNGTIELWLSGIIQKELAGSVTVTWWTGDFLGMLVLGPMALALLRDWRSLRRPPPAAVLILLMLTALCTAGIFFGKPEVLGVALPPYILLPFVAWAALCHSRNVVLLTLAVIIVIAVPATANGFGPFDSGLLQHSLLDLCLFIGISTLIAWVLATDSGALPRFSAIPLLALAVCMTLTVIAAEWVESGIAQDARERFDRSAAAVGNTLAQRMDTYESLLRACSALFESSNQVERREWRNFVAGMHLPSEYPGALGLGFTSFFPAHDLERSVAAIRADERPNFRIWPEGKREFYAPVVLLEPETASNLRVIGFDMLSEPVRQRALMAAMQNGRMSVTGPIILAQNTAEDKGLGFLLVNPAYAPPDESRPGRRLLGYVYAPLRIGELMAGIFNDQLRELRLEIFYDSLNSQPLFVSKLPGRGASYLNLENIQSVLVGDNGQQWTLRITPTALFDASIDQDKPFLLQMLGTTISLLFFGISRNLVRERQLAQLATDQSVARIREQEASLQVSEARFELLTSAIKNHAILLLGPDGTISTWNEGARKLFGYEESEIIGRPFSHLHVSGQADNGLETALDLGQYEAMGLRRRRDGSTFLGLAQIYPIRDEHGGCIGFAKIVRDVTDEKAAEKDLSDAKTQAEAASAAKSAFVANISHELRTPMNAVLGLAQVLARTPLNTEQRQYLDMISGAGKSLLALLNDVLDFSKIEANKLDLEDDDYLLDDVIDAISSVMAVTGGEKGLEMAIRVDAEVPASLHGDPQRVQQVLLNLVSNALKFTERGSVCMHVRLDPVRPGHVRFDVADTGIGIEPEQMERLFAPFSQADASMARKFGGTGLGLAISKRFASMMGGVIDVQTRPGAGATFSFSIPLRTGSLPDKYMLPAPLRGMSILYADASRTGRAAMSEMARRWGCSCELAASAQDLHAALAAGAAYSLVICDAAFALQAAQAIPPRAILLTVGSGAQSEAELRHPVTRSAIWHLIADGSEGRHLPAAPSPAAPAAAIAPTADRTLAGLMLLLAEDNPLNQVVAKGLLESAGARVEVANNGEEALMVLRRDTARFDLVLMDVQMPVMDGFTAARHIRRELKLSLPVIAMSAGVTLDERADCQAAGMDDFVAKPVDRAALVSAILRHVSSGLPALPKQAAQPPDGTFNVRHLEDLAARGLGNQAALVDMVVRALEHGAATAAQVRADVERGDLARAAGGLHSLRGTFGTLGARRVVQATQAAEVRMLEEPPGAPGPELDEVWRELAQTETLAREWLQRQPTMNDQ